MTPVIAYRHRLHSLLNWYVDSEVKQRGTMLIGVSEPLRH